MIISLNQKKVLSKNKVGGKAANLSKLFRSGFNIPTAFVLPVSVFESFAKKAKLLDKILDLSLDQSLDDLKAIALEIQEKIILQSIDLGILNEIEKKLNKAGISLLVVRSSINAEDGKKFSFAGQFESFLNIAVDDIESSIKKVWASCYSSRVMMYCFYNQINPAMLRPAVILQEMLQAEKGGIVFTRSPKPNHSLIEVCNGDLNSLTDGIIEPERYFVDEKNTIEEIQMKKDSPLQTSKSKIKRIAQVASRIEKLFNCSQDIEWILRNNKLIILQARPQTVIG
jgi:phosphoenolpyruvate synthase/pyruvate phosphate dikinase